MTLCIAGECEHDGIPAIVMCCDWRGTRGSTYQELVGSDDVYKMRDVFGMSALLAGSETEADRLLVASESAIQKFCGSTPSPDSDLIMDELLRDLEKAAASRKKKIIEHFVEINLGISYAELRATERSRLTDYQEIIWRRIEELTLGADVIIGGFSDEAVIVRLDRYGKAHWETNYSVIGEGADIALAFLCQQPWDFGGSSNPPTFGTVKPMTLMQCLYRVYEAKKAAEKNRSVGESTALIVLIQGRGKFEVSDACRERMQWAFDAKHRVPGLEFDSSFLEPQEEGKVGDRI